jgi:NADPH:quinone reductase-like Zn-dependent oxidoreductase
MRCPLRPAATFQELAALPYSFITMWLAVHGAELTRQNASGRKVLVHGAAGGLGTLALQMLSAWGASVTAIARPAAFDACRRSGAVSFIDVAMRPFSSLARSFDATLNFATWDDDVALVCCLADGALGHATTVHPMLRHFDERGWLMGALQVLRDKRRHRAALPKRTENYAWTTFRPDKHALSDLEELVEKTVLNLPIGLHIPLTEAGKSFEHVRNGRRGRALILLK